MTRRFLVNITSKRADDAAAEDKATEKSHENLREVIWPALKGNLAFADSREKPDARFATSGL